MRNICRDNSKYNQNSVNDFFRCFSNQRLCLDYIVNIRWPKGIFCPHCDKITKFYKVNQRNSYACSRCGYHIYPLKGTIFERSSTPVSVWFKAAIIFIMSSCKITIIKLQEQLQVSYKTAWRMRKKMSETVIDVEKTPTWGIVTANGNFFGLPEKKYIGRWNLYKNKKNGKLEKFFDLLIEEKDIYWKYIPKIDKWIRLKKV